MYNLYNEFEKCESALREINIPIAEVVAVQPNSRAKSRWGQCTRKNSVDGVRYIISINTDLLNEQNPLSALHTTVCHELLHTCERCMNHGKLWAEYAKIVNDALGLNIQRVSTAEEKKMVVFSRTEYKTGYAVTCKNCGRKRIYYRAGKVVKNVNNYSCGHCNGDLFVERLSF